MASPFRTGFNVDLMQVSALWRNTMNVVDLFAPLDSWLDEEMESFRRSVGQRLRRAHEANLVNLYDRCWRAGIKLP